MTSPQPGRTYDDPGRGFAALEPLPEGDLATLRGAAEMLDVFGGVSGSLGAPFTAAVDAMAGMVRGLLGDYGLAEQLARGWGDAQEPVAAIVNDLRTGLATVDIYWQGGAFEGFNTHASGVIDACKDTGTKLAEIGGLLSETVALVYSTYGDAVGFIVRSASACVGFFDPLTWTDAICGVVGEVGNLIESAIDTMGAYRTNLVKLDIAATGFPAPADVPAAIKDPTLWDVQPPPENPPDLD